MDQNSSTPASVEVTTTPSPSASDTPSRVRGDHHMGSYHPKERADALSHCSETHGEGGAERFSAGQAYNVLPSSPLQLVEEEFPLSRKCEQASNLVSKCPGGFFTFKKTQEEAVQSFNKALAGGYVVIIPDSTFEVGTYQTCIRYYAVPPGPLTAVPEGLPSGPWYTVTVGRYIGVFKSLQEAHWATVYCSGSLMKRAASQRQAIGQFNAALRNDTVSIVVGLSDLSTHPSDSQVLSITTKLVKMLKKIAIMCLLE
ncbi:uncharacterized protein ARMOST_11894 [Armillaria ostoyae]|uniref:Uncharacterized protein n=1 Tax=Armillaria ostoyae TaxID=47428 RepID=A0A284RIB3_ARMOS|nr:uncharacterized protein ARMOST_11864 [Armillaria ostoyae]SJL08530.1 uncharacterized protein ARMOST_11894 [Armillaria ostoyae]